MHELTHCARDEAGGQMMRTESRPRCLCKTSWSEATQNDTHCSGAKRQNTKCSGAKRLRGAKRQKGTHCSRAKRLGLCPAHTGGKRQAHTVEERSDFVALADRGRGDPRLRSLGPRTRESRPRCLCPGTHCGGVSRLCPGSEATGTHCWARGEGACSFGPRTTASGERSDL